MPKVDLLEWVWKAFGVGGLLSLALMFAVYKLWKYVKKIHAKINELHEKYSSKIEVILKDNQKRIDEINNTHENRMDEMSRAYKHSIEKISNVAHEDHMRMEFLIQGLNPH